MRKYLVLFSLIGLLAISFTFSPKALAKPYHHTRGRKIFTYRHYPRTRHVCNSGYWVWSPKAKRLVWVAGCCEHSRKQAPLIWLSWNWD